MFAKKKKKNNNNTTSCWIDGENCDLCEAFLLLLLLVAAVIFALFFFFFFFFSQTLMPYPNLEFCYLYYVSIVLRSSWYVLDLIMENTTTHMETPQHILCFFRDFFLFGLPFSFFGVQECMMLLPFSSGDGDLLFCGVCRGEKGSCKWDLLFAGSIFRNHSCMLSLSLSLFSCRYRWN